MGILDRIAQGGTGFEEGFNFIDKIRERQFKNKIMEIQIGKTLQDMQLNKQALERQQKAYENVGQYLRPPQQTTGQQTTTPQAYQPGTSVGTQETPQIATGAIETAPQTTETALPGTTPQGQEKPVKSPEEAQKESNDFMKFVMTTPTDQLSQYENYRSAGDALMAQGMPDQAEMMYEVHDQLTKNYQNSTKTEKEDARQAFERLGAILQKVDDYESTGDTDLAKASYDTNMNFIKRDPRFMKNKIVKATLDHFPQYEDGIGHYLYTTMSFNEKYRIQSEKQTGKRYRTTTTDGYKAFVDGEGKFIDYERDSKGNPIKDLNYVKEQRIGKQKKQQLALAEEKQNLAETKLEFNNTDSIMRFKIKEEKTLNEVKSGINRAMILIAKGGDMSLADKMLTQNISKLEGSKVRALAELQNFYNPGGVLERFKGRLSQLFTGAKTQSQRQEIMDVITTMLDQYIDPALNESNDRYRRLASERGLDPDQVEPYDTKEQVGEDYRRGIINREAAIKILSKPKFQ